MSNSKLSPSNRSGKTDYLFYKQGNSVHPVQISVAELSDRCSPRFLIHYSEAANDPLSFLPFHGQLDICPT